MNRLFTYNNKLVSPSSAKVLGDGLPPIAPKTMRFRFYDNFDPTTELSDQSAYGLTWTHVTHNIYDWTCTEPVWFLPRDPSGSTNTSIWNIYMYRAGSKWVYPMSTPEFDLIDSDLTGVTSVNRLFQGAPGVHHCLLKNTSDVADWTSCFYHRTNCMLETINRLDMSGVADQSLLNTVFHNCFSLSGDFIFDLPNLEAGFRYPILDNNCRFASSGSITLNIPKCPGSASNASTVISVAKNANSVAVPCTVNASSSLTSLYAFFSKASGISSVTINGWSPTGVNCSNTFSGCYNLAQVSLPTNAKVTDANRMFYQNNVLTTAPQLDLSSCTRTLFMFCQDTALTQVPSYDLSAVNVSAAQMFYGCTSLEYSPAFNLALCPNTASMYQGCTSLKQVPAITCPEVTSCFSMFQGCTAVESGALDMYNYLSTKATPVTTYGNTFTDCGSGTVTGQAELAQIPSSWGGTGV